MSDRERSPARRDSYNDAPQNSEDRSAAPAEDNAPPRGAPPPRGKYDKGPPQESNVLGVFGLSIRTQERDLEDEFQKSGKVDKVVIVYDQRSERSRGFGFVTMASLEDAARAIRDINGTELHGRRLRVDYSMTSRPHDPTPGKYMGVVDDRSRDRDRGYGRDDRDRPRGSYSRRDDYYGDRRDDRDRDHRSSRYDDRRDYRDSGHGRERSRSPPRRRYSRSRSRSPPRRDGRDGY